MRSRCGSIRWREAARRRWPSTSGCWSAGKNLCCGSTNGMENGGVSAISGNWRKPANRCPAWQWVRRWTGGGTVDHSNDWTYSLIVPQGNGIANLKGGESYRRIHEVLVRVLNAEVGAVSLSKRSGKSGGSVFRKSRGARCRGRHRHEACRSRPATRQVRATPPGFGSLWWRGFQAARGNFRREPREKLVRGGDFR